MQKRPHQQNGALRVPFLPAFFCIFLFGPILGYFRKYVEKQNDIGEGETATDAYQMLNTRLTKTFNGMGEGELKVSLFANNLLDEVARNHSSFVKNEVPLPGRNYGLKFNLTF